MGITDEQYAKEIEKLKAKMVLQATSASMPRDGTIKVTNKDLDHEAFNVSISTLVDMWIIRWQDTWVTEDEIREADDFWRIAFVRLDNVKKIEKHTLGDSYDKVYRIIE
jgi:hypothetical protein